MRGTLGVAVARWRRSVVAAVALVGCAAPAEPPGSTRDSAGIEIVSNPSRAAAPIAYQLVSPARMDLGGLEEADLSAEFSDRRGHANLVISSGGRRVIAIDDTLVKVFEPNGRLARVVGRHGSGPGEYGHLSGICLTRGDTLIVTDEFQSRFSILDSLGNPIRQVVTGGSKPLENACLDDGTIILGERARTLDPRGWSQLRLIRVNTLGRVVDTLGDFPESTMFMAADGQSGKYLHAVLAAGAGRLVWGDGQSHELRVYQLEPAIKLIRLIRTADRLGTILGKGFQLNPGDDRRLHPEESTHRHRMPVYEDLRIGQDGSIWLRDTVVRVSPDVLVPPRAGTWTRFDSAGKLVGRLVLPDSAPFDDLRVLRFGVDEIVISYSDRDGARHVAIHALSPGRATRHRPAPSSDDRPPIY